MSTLSFFTKTKKCQDHVEDAIQNQFHENQGSRKLPSTDSFIITIINFIIIIINLSYILQFHTNGILTALYIVRKYIQKQYIEGSRPEWYILTTIHDWDIQFWFETLDMHLRIYIKQSYSYTHTCLHIYTYTGTCANIYRHINKIVHTHITNLYMVNSTHYTCTLGPTGL